MDSITQIALGAAIGEATLGNKVGKAGALWGGLLGAIPDLDLISRLWLDNVAALSAHRAGSHSLFVITVLTPIVGSVLYRFHKKNPSKSWHWMLMFWLVGATHILLDTATVYGTQIFWPISKIPFSFDSIYVIDPFYSLPLIFFLLLALKAKKGSKKRFRMVALGLVLSSFYLTWGMGVKAYVHSSFRQGFASRGILPERLLTAPTPMNSVVWMGLCMSGDSLYAGLYSVLDKSAPRDFTPIARNTHLIEGHEQDRAVEKLLWFSKGWYSVEENDSSLVFTDHRFGRTDTWLTDEGGPMMSFELIEGENGYETAELRAHLPEDRVETLKALFERATEK